MNKVKMAIVAGSLMLATGHAYAVSDSAKIGANAGAMIYCYEHVASPSQHAKYKLLKLNTYDEYKKLPDGARAKALVVKKAAEDGDYLGDRLDKGRCDSLRKMLYIKYN
ncbi:hypothetical protein RJ45_17240 [Photobacterium gaetbulicola]|uniref:Valyl-tRNA synthetase n=1 Tax=Photobacterium gaetbulicola TaxID=1295392 RepID=A0A0B9G1H6_9GAMM|nr:hypothetical protein [Photobacterium gaetbulicola]KHT62549.1 hypothetical protein RJ45_17240 [Photobacterium gaetbulicola]